MLLLRFNSFLQLLLFLIIWLKSHVCHTQSMPTEQFIHPLFTKEAPFCKHHKRSLHAWSLNSLISWTGFCQVLSGAWTSANTSSSRSPGPEPAAVFSLVSPIPVRLPVFPNSFQVAAVGERVVCCVKVPASSCVSSVAGAVINCAKAAPPLFLFCHSPSANTCDSTLQSYLSICTAMQDCSLEVQEVNVKL